MICRTTATACSPDTSGHCVAKDTPYGQVATKDGADSPRKIDCAVAAMIAYDRAMWHAASSRPLEAFFAFV